MHFAVPCAAVALSPSQCSESSISCSRSSTSALSAHVPQTAQPLYLRPDGTPVGTLKATPRRRPYTGFHVSMILRCPVPLSVRWRSSHSLCSCRNSPHTASSQARRSSSFSQKGYMEKAKGVRRGQRSHRGRVYMRATAEDTTVRCGVSIAAMQ
jgi:hypothetical protein